MLRQKDEVRRRLGYLPQDFGVYPRISAHDMLDHIALLKGLIRLAASARIVVARDVAALQSLRRAQESR